jgi:fibronectin type 3 domain-containing protein
VTSAQSDVSVLSGTTYYYVSTAVDSSNVESAYSNQATAADSVNPIPTEVCSMA